MTGKKIVFLLLLLTIIVIIAAWFWIQHIIVEYDLERAMQASTYAFNVITKGKNFIP